MIENYSLKKRKENYSLTLKTRRSLTLQQLQWHKWTRFQWVEE